MGTLYYGAQRTPVHIEDRLLAHLKAVVLAKLRRQESLVLNIRETRETGSGRHTFWIHPYVELHFSFDGSRPPALDTDLIEQISQQATTARGVDLEDGATLIRGGRTS